MEKLLECEEVSKILENIDSKSNGKSFYRAEMSPSNKKWYLIGGLLGSAITHGLYFFFFGDKEEKN